MSSSTVIENATRSHEGKQCFEVAILFKKDHGIHKDVIVEPWRLQTRILDVEIQCIG